MSSVSFQKTGGYKKVMEGFRMSDFAQQIFPIGQLTDFIYSHLKINSKLQGKELENHIFRQVFQLDPDYKRKMINILQSKFGMTPGISKFISIIPEFNQYSESCITHPIKVLEQNKSTTIETHYPYENVFSHVGFQVLHIEFEAPELVSSPDLEPNEAVFYDYTSLPGIRLIERVNRKSNNQVFDWYTQYDVLKFNNDSVEENMRNDWYRLLGEDVGYDASKFDIVGQVNQVIKLRAGYQTPKKNPDPLVLNIPILFPYCLNMTERLNLLLFDERSLTLQFELAKSKNIIRARVFNEMDVTVEPYEVEVAPLKIKNMSLINKLTCNEEMIHNLYTGIPFFKLSRISRNNSYTITENSGDIELRGQGLIDHFAIALRPSTYKDDFEKWRYFTKINKQCTTSVGVVPDPLNPGQLKAVVVPFETYKEEEALTELELIHDDTSLTRVTRPAIFSQIDVFDKSSKCADFHTRSNQLYYMFFNQYPNGSHINAFYNLFKWDRPFVHYKFKDGYKLAPNSDILVEEYEMIVWRSIFTRFIGAGNNIASKEIIA